jgi:hypothetical protein
MDNANTLEYSLEAENIMSSFFDSDIMIYVEGKDDIIFWEIIFDKFAKIKTKIQDVGGSKELDKYAKKINSGDLNAIAACDGDFSLIKPIYDNDNIIITFGHSIENSLICENSLRKVVKSFSKISTTQASSIDSNSWLESFYSELEELILLDINNELKGLGDCVIGDNCTPVMKSKQSEAICKDKITKALSTVSDKALDADLQEIAERISLVDRDIKDFLKGHFLFSAALKFIKNTSEKINGKVSISNDAFYSTLVLDFENSLNKKHHEYSHYKSIIDNIKVVH